MAKGIHSDALQHVRMLFEAGTVGGLTDRQLLERFRAREGEAAELAFAALVQRHGPMILRVCQRTLRDEHDAEDAFQATFLVLVRKAGSLRTHDSLGGWLHAVAYRVAACARAAGARRRVHERKVAEAAPATTPAGDGGCDDLGPVLHEEIGRLPETYRAAVVLCDLEGLTQEQAAQRLGWPSGTVRSRLSRGRGRLQERLIRRGFAPTIGAAAALLTAEAVTAEVPAALVATTIRAATLAAAGQSIVGAVSAAALSETVLRGMFMTKLKLIFVAVLGIGAGVSGTAVLALQQAERPQVPGEAPRAPADPGSPKGAELSRPPEVPSQDPPEDLERQISLAELMLKRAQDRLAWSDRMYVKGYVSKAQAIADRHALKLATHDLELARLKLRMQRPARLPGNDTTEERKREETDREPLRAALANLSAFWPRSEFDEAELAELPPDGQPAILNWENAYALALIRSRAGQPVQGRARAEALDPKDLAEQREKYNIGDFARFRTEFLASQDDAAAGERGFRDPAGAILELLRRRQEVENARWNIAGLENLVKVLKNLIEKVSSGLSQLQLDQAEITLQDARLHLLDEREHYRVQLDRLKDRLGLSPRAAIALDKECLAGFRTTFEEADRWCADPRRDLTVLPRIARRLPALDDIVIDGHSAAAAAVAATAAQARNDAEQLFAAGVRLALKNKHRGDQGKAGVQEADDGGLEQRVRGELRGLLRIRVAYEIERRRLVLVVRGRDQAQERLLAPPGRNESPEHRTQLFTELIAIQGQMLETQDRLVSLWTEHQVLRLALFRDLGTLPCDDWKSFYDQLTARRSGDHG